MSATVGILLLTLSATPPSVPAPLVRFLTSARAKNHALGISRAQLAEQDAVVSQAMSSLTPSLRASGGYTRNQYEAVVTLPAALLGGGPPGATDTLRIQPYNAWSATVTLSVPLFSGANLYRYAGAARGLDAAAGGVRATEADVLLSTARAYYQVVASQGVVAAALRALATARDNLAVTRVKRAAGTQNRLAEDRAEVDVARAEQIWIGARQTLALAVRSLETLSGDHVDPPLPDPEVNAPLASTEEVLNVPIDHWPDTDRRATGLRQEPDAANS